MANGVAKKVGFWHTEGGAAKYEPDTGKVVS